MAVVIVDDSAEMRSALRRIVEDAGLEVRGEASDGTEALDLVERVHPQIVILDGRMPTADGCVTTQWLKARYPDVKVVAHTSDPDLAEQMLLLGAVVSVDKGASNELARVLLRLSEPTARRRGVA